jgi:PEP-CTERM motif
MKYFSKFSALGAVLVLTTAFASADTTGYFGSGSGTVTYLGYSTTLTGAPVIQAAGVNNTPSVNCNSFFCQSYAIDPGTVWAPVLVDGSGQASTWVSYDFNSGPTGSEATPDANGFYTYTTGINLPFAFFGTITVAADDTVAVFLNGVQISDLGFIGSDSKCADGAPNCRDGGTITFSYSAPAGFNAFNFVVDQSGSYDQGLDYVGSITQTPEPNTLFLLGTGLMGSAGALFRKMRA